MKNRINFLFNTRGDRKLLSIYFCAGAPTCESTTHVILTLQERGIDMIEVGIPFSDPMADGPVIQQAAAAALRNGMTLEHLLDQLHSIRDQIRIPLVLMGYLNVIMQYGYERFFRQCVHSGVSGVIIPDLPFHEYMEVLKPMAEQFGVHVIMLITPETSEERIRFIDQHTDGFIYMVSSASTTGAQVDFDKEKLAYFRRIQHMQLRNPRMIGFGISNLRTLQHAQQHADGAIIGSKFVQLLQEKDNPAQAVETLLLELA